MADFTEEQFKSFVEDLLKKQNNDQSFYSKLQEQEKSIFVDSKLIKSKSKLDELSSNLDSYVDEFTDVFNKLEKANNALKKVAKEYGETSEQYQKLEKYTEGLADQQLSLQIDIEDVRKRLKEVTKEYSAATKELEEATQEYEKRKKSISQTMSNVITEAQTDVELAIHGIQAAQEKLRSAKANHEKDYDATEELKVLEGAEIKKQEALERRNKVQEVEYKFMSASERSQAIFNEYKKFRSEKKDLDKQLALGMSEEDYNLKLSTLNKNYAGKGIGTALLNQALGGLQQGKSIKEIVNSGIENGLSLSPAGQAVLVISKYVQKIYDTLGKGIDEAANLGTNYLSKIDSRLQGSILDTEGGSYKKIIKDVTEAFSVTPYVNQKKLLESINRLSDSGIAWNLEQRALINTLADKMVSTFDALDVSLTRLIRIQGADTTAMALGAEAELTKFLNKNFNDTSYLNSLYDTVSGAVLDASAQLNYGSAIGFNYAVQKWLGSLYSVGMSESGVSTIAQGLNYLATGNVEALAGNTSLQNLLALSAQNAGLDYADLLRNGLNADTTDILLESMVRYLQGIYQSMTNNVTKSAWTNISGLSITDLRSIANLSQEQISTISNNDVNYVSAYNSFQDQLSKVEERTGVAEWVDNLFDNLLVSFGNRFLDYNKPEEVDPGDLLSYLLWRGGRAFGGIGGTLIQTGGLLTSLFDNFNFNAAMNDPISRKNGASAQSINSDNWLSNLLNNLFNIDSLDTKVGFSNVLNSSGWFRNQELVTDRALSYIPLLAAVSGESIDDLVSSGVDLGSFSPANILTGTPKNTIEDVIKERYSNNRDGSFSRGYVRANGRGAVASEPSSFLEGLSNKTGPDMSTGVTEGTSFGISTADDKYSLVNTANRYAQKVTVTGGNESEITTRTVYDLYVALFEKREVPIRVQLANLEEEARAFLKKEMTEGIESNVRYLADQAAGTGINVDLGSEDISLMRNQIYNIKYAN